MGTQPGWAEPRFLTLAAAAPEKRPQAAQKELGFRSILPPVPKTQQLVSSGPPTSDVSFDFSLGGKARELSTEPHGRAGPLVFITPLDFNIQPVCHDFYLKRCTHTGCQGGRQGLRTEREIYINKIWSFVVTFKGLFGQTHGEFCVKNFRGM